MIPTYIGLNASLHQLNANLNQRETRSASKRKKIKSSNKLPKFFTNSKFISILLNPVISASYINITFQEHNLIENT